jgi:hypothetical protein
MHTSGPMQGPPELEQDGGCTIESVSVAPDEPSAVMEPLLAPPLPSFRPPLEESELLPLVPPLPPVPLPLPVPLLPSVSLPLPPIPLRLPAIPLPLAPLPLLDPSPLTPGPPPEEFPTS